MTSRANTAGFNIKTRKNGFFWPPSKNQATPKGPHETRLKLDFWGPQPMPKTRKNTIFDDFWPFFDPFLTPFFTPLCARVQKKCDFWPYRWRYTKNSLGGADLGRTPLFSWKKSFSAGTEKNTHFLHTFLGESLKNSEKTTFFRKSQYRKNGHFWPLFYTMSGCAYRALFEFCSKMVFFTLKMPLFCLPCKMTPFWEGVSGRAHKKGRKSLLFRVFLGTPV